MTPAESALLYQALAGAGVLFVIAYIGNQITFSHRLLNALITAVIFAAVFAGVYYLIDRSTLPTDIEKPDQMMWIRMVGISAILVFVIDFVANILSFSNRFLSAVTTAVIFALLFVAIAYASGQLPSFG